MKIVLVGWYLLAGVLTTTYASPPSFDVASEFLVVQPRSHRLYRRTPFLFKKKTTEPTPAPDSTTTATPAAKKGWLSKMVTKAKNSVKSVKDHVTQNGLNLELHGKKLDFHPERGLSFGASSSTSNTPMDADASAVMPEMEEQV